MLSSSRVYVGGSVNPRALQGARVHNNFVGCLRKVEFSADTLRLNLIDLARTGSKLIQVAGRIEYTCPIGDPQDPVTFTTRDSHLVKKIVNKVYERNVSFNFNLLYHLRYCLPGRREKRVSFLLNFVQMS